MRDVGLHSGVEACTLIDELGPQAIGELIVSGDDGARGAVFVEQGRVCWAAARGLARRLTELLVDRAKLAPSAMESLFTSCKREHVPLGEHLVGQGVLSAEALREALLAHTVESLCCLCEPRARARWCPRSGNGYSPRFTFATSEIAASIGATNHRACATRLRAVLDDTFASGEWAAAFVRGEGRAAPEPVAIRGSVPPATILLRFGKWAASALDVTAVFADDSALLVVERASLQTPTSLVAFRDADAFVVGETSAHGPARMLNRRAKERRQGDGDADL